MLADLCHIPDDIHRQGHIFRCESEAFRAEGVEFLVGRKSHERSLIGGIECCKKSVNDSYCHCTFVKSLSALDDIQGMLSSIQRKGCHVFVGLVVEAERILWQKIVSVVFARRYGCNRQCRKQDIFKDLLHIHFRLESVVLCKVGHLCKLVGIERKQVVPVCELGILRKREVLA